MIFHAKGKARGSDTDEEKKTNKKVKWSLSPFLVLFPVSSKSSSLMQSSSRKLLFTFELIFYFRNFFW